VLEPAHAHFQKSPSPSAGPRTADDDGRGFPRTAVGTTPATMKSTRSLVAFATCVSALLGTSPCVGGDTIKHPGDHISYSVEVEPHVLVGWTASTNEGGLVSRALSIPIVQNGFIPSINNSVAISFGLDLLWYAAVTVRGSGHCGAQYLQIPRCDAVDFWSRSDSASSASRASRFITAFSAAATGCTPTA